MIRRDVIRFACGFATMGLLACAPFPVPSDWPVKTKADAAKVRSLDHVVASARPLHELTRQERALLTFLSDNNRIDEAIGKRNHYGIREWRIAEIFFVEPGKRVSVLCEDGHEQEPLYFRYSAENSVWYRVEDFENPQAKAYPALIVEKR